MPMRNIFKKLHIGSSHDPSRSNESPSTVSPSCGSDHRASSGVSPSSSSPPTDAASVNTAATGPAPQAVNRQDYYSSEEEYQVQLALALSVSGTDGPEGSDEERIRALSMMSLGRQGASNSVRERDDKADSLSRQYWDYGVLDYDEKVVEGFYDIYGLCTDPAVQGKMPSLAELETKPGTSGFEVIIVNRRIDPSLEELLQIARCIYLDRSVGEVNVRVQRLAELVTDHLGGPVKDANTILAKWVERSTDLRISLHTTVLPIGSLKIGLSRHRALLFKVVADNVDLPCRLVKGSHYTGVEDDAVNIIKLKNESEFLVDLMGAPGTLIPADILSTKDMTFNPNASNLSKLPTFQTGHDSEIFYPVLKPLLGDVEGSKSSVAESSLHLGQKSNSENAESSLPHASGEGGVGSSGTPTVSPLNPHATSLHTGILYKGGRGSYASSDGSRMNVNIVPCSQSATEDSQNLFAHLNPFEVKGAGKGSVLMNQGWNKANEPRKPRNDLASGRPPAPLNWKNRQPCNEVSKKKESDFLEELFPRSSQEANDSTSSSLSFSSSSNVSEIVHSDTLKLQSSDYPKHRDYGDRNPFLGSNTILDPKKNQSERLSSEESSNILSRDKYFKDEKVWKNDPLGMAKDHGKNVIGMDGHRKQTNDKLVRTNNNLKNPEHSSSLFGSGAGQMDPLMDDVGECEIPWEDLVIGERIGLGSYGEVYRADWNGTEVAVKKFLDQDFSGDALAEFRREVRIMRRLRHQNVVTFMGAVTRPPNLSIVTEFLPRGSLYRIIHRPNCPIDEKRRIKMALDVAEGMNCLHTSKPTIVHRDLKSPNLLVDNNWNVKVCDFGLSRLKHNTFLSSKSTAGTPEWMAPEVLRNEPSNEKCDIYSFGVILWELATLRLPWSGMNPMQVVGAVGFQNRRLDISKDIDPLVARMIWECWQTDPNLRPSFAQLIVALKPLQRLVLPSHLEQQNSTLPQEISVNSTP